MPVPDKDGGMVWNGFSPRTITDRLPKDTTTSVPFRFGGSNVWAYTTPKGRIVKVKK
jgi:hypothetical protein